MLVISENDKCVLREQIGKKFHLKKESIGPPKIYFGIRLHKGALENGVKAWAFGSTYYIRAVIKNVEW